MASWIFKHGSEQQEPSASFCVTDFYFPFHAKPSTGHQYLTLTKKKLCCFFPSVIAGFGRCIYSNSNVESLHVCGQKEFRLAGGSVKIPTVVVDGVDESHSYMGMVVSYQHNVKKFLAIWVEFPHSDIYCLQCLRQDTKKL